MWDHIFKIYKVMMTVNIFIYTVDKVSLNYRDKLKNKLSLVLGFKLNQIPCF